MCQIEQRYERSTRSCALWALRCLYPAANTGCQHVATPNTSTLLNKVALLPFKIMEPATARGMLCRPINDLRSATELHGARPATCAAATFPTHSECDLQLPLVGTAVSQRLCDHVLASSG